MLATPSRPVERRQLEALREDLTPGLRRDFRPAEAADIGRGDASVRVTVLVSADEAISGEGFADATGVAGAGARPVAVGDGPGRIVTGGEPDRTSVAAGAVDVCTGVLVAGGAAGRVEAVAGRLRAPR